MVKQTVKREDEMRKKKRLPLVSSSSSSADAIALGLSLAALHWEMCSTELELPGGESLSFFFLLFLSISRLLLWYSGEAAGGERHGSRDCAQPAGSHEAEASQRKQGTGYSTGAKRKYWGGGKVGMGWGCEGRMKGERKGKGKAQNRPLVRHGAERDLQITTQILSEGKFQPCLPAAVTCFRASRVCRTHTHTPYAKQDAAAQEQRLWNRGYLWQLIKLEPQSTDEFILACCTALHNAGVTVSRSNRRKWLEPALTELNRARFMR